MEPVSKNQVSKNQVSKNQVTNNQVSNNQALIRFDNVYKSFGTNQVLRGINLSIYPGQLTAIIGKSGEGKSVLLKHIIGLINNN
ncbi:ATP-binding cassette domain-containing protein, partial [Desulfobacterales bacterium HSG17]|nr:ATP-binding cassette domain-containing protein [Desulfobacterales bacterium HSG17]